MSKHIREPENLGLEHVLAFCYLYFSKETDGNLDDDELKTMSARIGEWLGRPADALLVKNSIMDADLWYSSCSHDERAHALRFFVKKFNEVLRSHHRDAIIADLYAIASADGVISTNEARLLNSLAEELGVDFRVSMPD